MKKAIVFLLLCAIIASCKRDEKVYCFESAGPEMKTVLPLQSFRKLRLEGKMDVVLVQDSLMQAEIETGEHLQDGIHFSYDEDCLNISNENRCLWLRKLSHFPRITIHLADLCRIRADHYGQLLTADTLRTDSLYLEVWKGNPEMVMQMHNITSTLYIHSNSASLDASGRVGVAYISNGGAGPMHCENLRCDIVFVKTRSTNHTFVNVSNWLGAEINWKGNIYYRGTPGKIDLLRTNEGKLIPWE